MDTSAVPLQRLAFSLTLALIAVIVLTVLMNDTNARSYALPSPRASASEPPQEPPLCLADVAIVLDVGGSMQEDTRCYGCWEGAGDYPQGITYPLPFGDHCQASDPLAYQGYYYLFIEAEHYSRYPYEADYHWNFTEFPKTWWAMQRQPNRSASGPDVRGAFMMVGPNSPGALYYETLDDIRHPPDLHTTSRLDYDFTVPVSGTYYAWIRAQGGVSYTLNGWAGGRESRRRVHVGLDSVPMAMGETSEWGPYTDGADPDNWRWSRMPLTLTLNATGPGDPYTLNVWAAGPGFRLDKIVITNNPGSGLASKPPLTWDLPGAPDAGPAETHGRTGWACMGPDHPTPDPRFVPVDPQTGQLDDLYDDLQPIRAAKEAFKGMLQAPWSDLDPALDQVGYVVYSATSRIEHELYCLIDPGACADWNPVVEAIEAICRPECRRY